jgi:hypothetical protein
MSHTQKPDFVFLRNGRVHLNRRGPSVQSTAGSRGVRISGSNAGYIIFRGSVKSTGYPLHSPVSPSFPSHAAPCAITFQPDSNTVRTVHKLSNIYCFQFVICLHGTLLQFVLHFFFYFLIYVFNTPGEEWVTSCRSYTVYVYCSVQVLLHILPAVLYI